MLRIHRREPCESARCPSPADNHQFDAGWNGSYSLFDNSGGDRRDHPLHLVDHERVFARWNIFGFEHGSGFGDANCRRQCVLHSESHGRAEQDRHASVKHLRRSRGRLTDDLDVFAARRNCGDGVFRDGAGDGRHNSLYLEREFGFVADGFDAHRKQWRDFRDANGVRHFVLYGQGGGR